MTLDGCTVPAGVTIVAGRRLFLAILAPRTFGSVVVVLVVDRVRVAVEGPAAAVVVL